MPNYRHFANFTLQYVNYSQNSNKKPTRVHVWAILYKEWLLTAMPDMPQHPSACPALQHPLRICG